ncbi:MAG TPA: Sec-independent protein translocase subunit TatB [Campylobacterales bacterium]|nr:Sec-independent protein translocase subunit TatB [Campylobacterales bacterium]
MFGMGFTEILLIAVVAILFLGPDKLPDAMVKVAKFIKGAKNAITEAKSAIDSEVKISELKDEAMGYKAQLEAATDELQGFKNLNPMNQLKESFDDGTYGTSPEPEKALEKPKETPTVTTPVEPKQDESFITKKRNSESEDKQ